MGDVVNLKAYKESKAEEKERLRCVYVTNNRIESVENLLCNINNCIGVSILTKHSDYMGDIGVKEINLDAELLSVVYDSINTYCNKLKDVSHELENISVRSK